jgi:hypothetical protein
MLLNYLTKVFVTLRSRKHWRYIWNPQDNQTVNVFWRGSWSENKIPQKCKNSQEFLHMKNEIEFFMRQFPGRQSVASLNRKSNQFAILRIFSFKKAESCVNYCCGLISVYNITHYINLQYHAFFNLKKAQSCVLDCYGLFLSDSTVLKLLFFKQISIIWRSRRKRLEEATYYKSKRINIINN